MQVEVSEGLEKELEILKRVSGLGSGELLQLGISILRIHVAMASEGREITISATSVYEGEKFRLPFELKECYPVKLSKPRVEQEQSRFRRWFRFPR